MSSSINGTTITLTRGDTFRAHIAITDSEGNEYTPQSGDSIRFAAKKNFKDLKPIIKKTIPIDTLILHLTPEDTKKLPFGEYQYDIQLTYADGDVDTFITNAILQITEEID